MCPVMLVERCCGIQHGYRLGKEASLGPAGVGADASVTSARWSEQEKCMAWVGGILDAVTHPA